jgi:hypothetical protein
MLISGSALDTFKPSMDQAVVEPDAGQSVCFSDPLGMCAPLTPSGVPAGEIQNFLERDGR